MSINFIPNDPRAGNAAPAMRTKTPRPNRPSTKTGFTFSSPAPQGVSAPGTPGFLFWQCREGAIAALEAFEKGAGPHRFWEGNRRKLLLRQDDGEDVNAFYDRQSFSFFHKDVGGTNFQSGASTDVVAHEIGHGILDSLRPELWDVNFLEAGAFHEAFGDCIAILTALEDKETRVRLLQQAPNLQQRNFVESTAEDLSEGIRRLQPNHNAAEPRHAFNTHKFQIPDTLPSNGGPGKLINEVHAFGMVFTGCFWDLVANIFNASASKTELNLRKAARKAGGLLVAGAKSALVTPRFIQSVGRAMVLADEAANGGANRDHIRNAFQAHNVLLGTNAMLAPTVSLEGSAPARSSLAQVAKEDLKRKLGATRGARLAVSEARGFGRKLVRAVHNRQVDLGSVHSALKGVIAIAEESVMVGASGKRAAVMGAMPQKDDSESEVRAFVKSLIDHGRIDLGTKAKGFAAKMKDGAGLGVTHVIKTVSGQKQLKRVRFQCFCCR